MLLTNHSPFAQNDRVLVRAVGQQYGIAVSGFHGYQGGQRDILGANIGHHPATQGIGHLYFRNSHILSYGNHANVDLLATIPGLPTPNNAFAVAVDSVGRVVLGADSGFLCDVSSQPDTGYITHHDNRLFVQQLVEWLYRLR